MTRFLPKNTTVIIHAQNGLRLDGYTGVDYYFENGLRGMTVPIGIAFMFTGILFCFGDGK
jgi:hypothetical protein